MELDKQKGVFCLIQAVGAINGYDDPEYIRILMELRKLGITPSGNKTVDRGKLVQEKHRLEEKFKIEPQQPDKNQAEREKLEEQRTGATALAEINKILLGL